MRRKPGARVLWYEAMVSPAAAWLRIATTSTAVRSSTLALTVLLSLGACGQPRPPLAQDTFVDVLVEIHLLDARPHADSAASLRQAILQRYGVTESSFDAALAYHVERPEAFSEVYRIVIDRLTEEGSRSDGPADEQPSTEGPASEPSLSAIR